MILDLSSIYLKSSNLTTPRGIKERDMADLIVKFRNELRTHNNICDQIINERFEMAKHQDKWMDDLFVKYQESKTRLKLLSELIG